MEKIFYTTRKGTPYSIDEKGVVRNVKSGRPRLGSVNRGYNRLVIESKSFRVHRLVAKLFIPNPDEKPIVNHIDGNRQNNNALNLEWVTSKENTQHAIKRGSHPSSNLVSFPNIVRYMRQTHTDAEISATTGVALYLVELVR